MRSQSNTLSVDGTEYTWSVHREPQWCTADGWKGLSLAVQWSGGQARTLIIELPFRIDDHRSTPHRQRPNVSVATLEQYIRAAIEDGWDPQSRGKDYVYAPLGDA